MINIKVSTAFPSWPLKGQTPKLSCKWDKYNFLIDSDVPECDFWVVYDGLTTEQASNCCPKNTILILGEPPSIKKYDHRFLSQFAVVIACDPNIDHPNVIHSQQALPWHAGIIQESNGNVTLNLDYDYFSSMKDFPKSKNMSIICSSKAYTEGHKQRICFLEKIMSYFGHDVDVYGRGFNPIADKWSAIYPYKYHIVLENCSVPDYWTEKLSDALLAGSYPIYYGCTNLSDYFPNRPFTPIDIEDSDQAISVIEDVINKGLYESNTELIKDARLLILNKYNLFPMIAELCSKMSFGHAKRIKLKPELSFTNSPSIQSYMNYPMKILKQYI
jgi:hypothetical protein